MSIPRPIGDQHILQRRIPTNPKFEHTHSTVDTGTVLMNPGIHHQRRHSSSRSPFTTTSANTNSALCGGDVASFYTKMKASEFLSKVIPFHEDLSMSDKPSTQPPPSIVVDVRPGAENSIVLLPGSVRYNISQLNHSTNPFPVTIFSVMKHPQGTLYLIDNSEDILCSGASHIANRFVERGCERVVVLAKGMDNLMEKFGDVVEAWVQGVPLEDVHAMLELKIQQYRAQRGGSCASTTSSVMGGGPKKTKGLSTSLARSVAGGGDTGSAKPWK